MNPVEAWITVGAPAEAVDCHTVGGIVDAQTVSTPLSIPTAWLLFALAVEVLLEPVETLVAFKRLEVIVLAVDFGAFALSVAEGLQTLTTGERRSDPLASVDGGEVSDLTAGDTFTS